MGTVLRGGVVAICGMIMGVVLWTNLDWKALRRWATRSPQEKIGGGPPVLVENHLPKAGAPASPAVLGAQAFVASIEADGPGGLKVVGAGVLVDASGLVATSYHVANDVTAGSARFRDGAVFEIEGYAAIDRENDLAILKLRKSPIFPAVARLAASTPPQLAPVVAIGHPRGIGFSLFDGKVSRLVRTAELPAGSQSFLCNLTGSGGDQLWVQHTATLSEGNSGGPLVDEQGAVVGLNTWVDRQSDYSYAIEVGRLRALLQRPLPEIEPLLDHASPEASLKSQVWHTSAERLRDLREQAQKMRWRPHSRAQYAVLQQLAWSVAAAQRPELFAASPTLNRKLEELAKEADVVAAQLRGEKWRDIGQITILNEFAAGEIGKPGRGLAFFGTIERIVEGSGGERAAIIRLAGFDIHTVVPLTNKLAAPEAGTQCFLLGVNFDGKTLAYGDNPLQPIIAPVLTAPILVELK